MDPALVALLSVVGTLVVVVVVVVALAGGLARLGLAWRVLRDSSLAGRLDQLLNPPPPEPPKPPKPSAAPIRFLTLLQREGRLVDFLTENIQAYDDAQVGAAVREIHRKCQAALNEHLELEPIVSQEEGGSIDVPAGFDPAAIRLIGNVTGQPPFHGTVQHRGWRAKEIKLPAAVEGQNEFILQPAEVELP